MLIEMPQTPQALGFGTATVSSARVGLGARFIGNSRQQRLLRYRTTCLQTETRQRFSKLDAEYPFW